jgi:hypothetical protein
MNQPIPPLSFYDTSGYSDTDRVAATLLRAPLLALLHAMPAAERAEWLASLIGGLHHGVTQGPQPDPASTAYAVGQRMALMITEEGHA